MPLHVEPQRVEDASPLMYASAFNTANNTANLDITIPAPGDPSYTLRLESLAVNIATAGTTTVTIFDTVSAFYSFSVGVGGGYPSPCQRIFTNLPVTANPGQQLRVRLVSDASRTSSVVSITASYVVSN